MRHQNNTTTRWVSKPAVCIFLSIHCHLMQKGRLKITLTLIIVYWQHLESICKRLEIYLSVNFFDFAAFSRLEAIDCTAQVCNVFFPRVIKNKPRPNLCQLWTCWHLQILRLHFRDYFSRADDFHKVLGDLCPPYVSDSAFISTTLFSKKRYRYRLYRS